MNRATVVGCGFLALALAIGCNRTAPEPAASHEDAVMREFVANGKRALDLLEKGFGDGAGAQEFQRLNKRGRDLKQTIDSWPAEKREAMEKKYKAQLDRNKEQQARIVKKMFTPQNPFGLEP